MKDNFLGHAYYRPEYCFDLLNRGGTYWYRLDTPLWERMDQETWINISKNFIKTRVEHSWLHFDTFMVGEYGWRESGYRN